MPQYINRGLQNWRDVRDHWTSGTNRGDPKIVHNKSSIFETSILPFSKQVIVFAFIYIGIVSVVVIYLVIHMHWNNFYLEEPDNSPFIVRTVEIPPSESHPHDAIVHFIPNADYEIATDSKQQHPKPAVVKSHLIAKPLVGAPHQRLRGSVPQDRNSTHQQYLYDESGCLITTSKVDRGPHITAPPVGPMSIVCCQTTAGAINLSVHKSWAPIGASNFLDMIGEGFLSAKVPFYKVVADDMVRFGLSGDPVSQKSFEESIGDNSGFLMDDPNWLPTDPSKGEINGITRFQKGYVTYSGSSLNSRKTEIAISYRNNPSLGGRNPWEVPFGQLIGDKSFATLNAIYAGYGAKVQEDLIREKGVKYLKDFPLLDYILTCSITTKSHPWIYVNGTNQG